MTEEPFSRTIVRYHMNSHIGLSCIDIRVKRVLGLNVRQVSRENITLSSAENHQTGPVIAHGADATAHDRRVVKQSLEHARMGIVLAYLSAAGQR
jgi:hypothetical protein